MTISGGHFRGIAQVILYVAVSHGEIRRDIAFKFVKNLLVCLAHYVSQYIQPSPVSHANYHFFHVQFSGFANGLVQEGNGVFTTFQRKSLLADVFCMKKVLENYGFVEFGENAFFFFYVGIVLNELFFSFLLEPLYNFHVADVHVFKAYGAKIGFLKRIDDVSEGGFA